jgi:hypothetical protein
MESSSGQKEEEDDEGTNIYAKLLCNRTTKKEIFDTECGGESGKNILLIIINYVLTLRFCKD